MTVLSFTMAAISQSDGSLPAQLVMSFVARDGAHSLRPWRCHAADLSVAQTFSFGSNNLAWASPPTGGRPERRDQAGKISTLGAADPVRFTSIVFSMCPLSIAVLDTQQRARTLRVLPLAGEVSLHGTDGRAPQAAGRLVHRDIQVG